MDVERVVGLFVVTWPASAIFCCAIDKAIREARGGDWRGVKVMGGMLGVVVWYAIGISLLR